MPGAVLTEVTAGDGAVILTGGETTGFIAGVPEGVVTRALASGAELSGAPTAISHRWPGSPCAGFIPFAVAVIACGCGAPVATVFIIVLLSVVAVCCKGMSVVLVEALFEVVSVTTSVAVVAVSLDWLQAKSMAETKMEGNNIFFIICCILSKDKRIMEMTVLILCGNFYNRG